MDLDIIAGGIILAWAGISIYREYKTKKLDEQQDSAMKKFQEERHKLILQFTEQYLETEKLGLDTSEVCQIYLDKVRILAKKHNLETITNDLPAEGNFEAEKVIKKPDGTIERYVSNGKKWVRYE